MSSVKKTEDQVSEPEKTDQSLIKQLSCAFVVNLVSLLQGASVSSSSIILHELENSTEHIQDNHCHRGENCSTTNNVILGPFAVFDDFHVTQEEGSWIASSWVLGHLVSAIFAGFVSDAIGRKKSLLLDTAVFFLGFVMLATGHLPACLIIGRLLLGYPLVSQVYISEILNVDRRGLGAAMYSVLHSFGFFLVLFTGAYLPWRIAVFLPGILAIPTFVLIMFLHESPEWLLKKGRIDEYKKSVKFFQIDKRQFDDNQDIFVGRENKNKENDNVSMCESVFSNLGSVSKSLIEQDRSFWRRVLFLSVLFALIGWCGFSILSFYATEIFTKSGSPISATHTSWITASTKIFCAILSFYVLHKFSRKFLFATTSTLIFLSFTSMSVYTLLDTNHHLSPALSESLNFVPMISIILAYVGYGLGYGVIPSLLAAELMPVPVRSTAVGFFQTVEMCSTFVLTKMKPILMEALDIHGMFAMFAMSVFSVIILTLFFTPRDKTTSRSSSISSVCETIKV